MNTRTNTVVEKSYVYMAFASATWVLWALFLPLYRPIHIIAVTILSLCTARIGKWLYPDKVYTYEEPATEPEPEKTGNAELDAIIQERDKAVAQMRSLNDQIPGEKMSATIQKIETTTKLIFSAVITDPEKIPDIRRFLDYYLPTAIKLMSTYARLDAAGLESNNILDTKKKIEDALDRVADAFKQQLEKLFGDDVLDISAEITVMENLLKQEGLDTAMSLNTDNPITLSLSVGEN